MTLVTRLGRLLAQLVVANARDFEVRRIQRLVGHDHDRRVMALLDLGQRAALLVEQVVGDLGRSLHQHLAGVLLHRVLLGQAKDRQRQGLDAAHAAVAFATRAHQLAGLAQRRTQALAAHLKQAETRDAADLHAGAVMAQRVLQLVLDIALVLAGRHVDEIDHHQPAQVAQAHLACDLLGGLQVGVERRVLDVAALGGARGVHVDGGQRLGLVDDQRATGRQAHFALVRAFDLRFDLEAVEQRHVVRVRLQLAQVVRHDLLDELARFQIHLGRVDQDLADVGAHVVAQRTDDQARLLVDQERALALGVQRGLDDRVPDVAQVVEVPLQLFRVTADAGGADDHAHVVGDVERVHRTLQLGAVLTLDPARYATRARRVRHQDHVATGQRDERGQGRALVAALLLVDLDHDLLAFTQEFAHAGFVVVDTFREVIAGNFLQREEPVAFGAVIDKGCFERGLEAGDLALVDVGLLLFLRRLFDVDVVQGLAVDDRDAQFFRLRRIDEHALHGCVLARFTRDNAGGVFASGDRGSTVANLAPGRVLFQRCNTTACRGSACQ